MQRRAFVRSATVAVAVGVAGCLSSDDGGAETGVGQVVETTSVAVQNSQFDPRNVAVDVGAEVTWTNEDGSKHTVTAASDDWTLDREVASGKTVSHAFQEAGVFGVYCRFHGGPDLSGMSMKLAVGDASIDQPLGDDDGMYG